MFLNYSFKYDLRKEFLLFCPVSRVRRQILWWVTVKIKYRRYKFKTVANIREALRRVLLRRLLLLLQKIRAETHHLHLRV